MIKRKAMPSVCLAITPIQADRLGNVLTASIAGGIEDILLLCRLSPCDAVVSGSRSRLEVDASRSCGDGLIAAMAALLEQ